MSEPLYVEAEAQAVETKSETEIFDFESFDFKSLISASVCSKCGITKVTEVAWNELDANLQDYHRQPSNRFKRILGTFKPVSYTHLTLPTSTTV